MHFYTYMDLNVSGCNWTTSLEFVVREIFDGVYLPVGTGWTSLALPLSCTCHALAARKYWRVRIDPNPNISSAASVWLDQTPSIVHGFDGPFFDSAVI